MAIFFDFPKFLQLFAIFLDFGDFSLLTFDIFWNVWLFGSNEIETPTELVYSQRALNFPVLYLGKVLLDLCSATEKFFYNFKA